MALDLGSMNVDSANIWSEDPLPLKHMQQAQKGLSRPTPEQQTHGFDKSTCSIVANGTCSGGAA